VRRADELGSPHQRLTGSEVACEPRERTARDGQPNPVARAKPVGDRVEVDPQLVVDNMATMEQRLSESVARPRFYATLVGVFAFIALVLAAGFVGWLAGL